MQERGMGSGGVGSAEDAGKITVKRGKREQTLCRVGAGLGTKFWWQCQ